MQTKLRLFCEKVIEAGWLAALILVPVYFNIYTARTFEPDKLTLMRSIALVMALAWLIKVAESGFALALAGPNGEKPKGSTPGVTQRGLRKLLDVPLFLPTLLLVIAYLISTVLSISPLVALWGSYQRLQGTYTALSYIVIFALLATHLRTRAQLDRLVTTVILTSLPVGLYGIIQHFGLDPLPWAGDVTTRVASSLGNAIFVASYLIMAIPLILARLLDSMASLLNEEDASWGHTILSAVYIFILAVDVLTVLFSKSRGPLLGLLAASFFFVFLALLSLHHRREKVGAITLGDGVRSVLETGGLLGIGGVLGILAYRLAGPISVGQASLDLWGLLAAGILLGVVANVLLIGVQVAMRRGWARLWLNWVLLAVFMAIFLVSLNVPQSPFISLRSLSTVGRLTELFQAEQGSGRVRVLIWEGVLKLISPHEPLGIPGEFSDRFNVLRPLIGYGPESMFNSFAEVYPPELAHVERRGSSADRSHNETFDMLAMTGILGFVAYYFLMFSLFYYLLKAVGWIPDNQARRRLLALLGTGAILGIAVPRLLTGDFVFSAVGLPASMLFMMFVYLVWQALVGADQLRPGDGEGAPNAMAARSATGRETLLLLGVFTALVAHFVEVHFVFSIAATYLYFWAYAGVLVAWMRSGREFEQTPVVVEQSYAASGAVTDPQPVERSARRRKRRRSKSTLAQPAAAPAAAPAPQHEDWETWLGVLGLVAAIILVAMIFDFVTVQFDITRARFSMLWMFAITWGLGLAVGLGEVAIRNGSWQRPLNWGRAVLLYVATSLGYSIFFLMVHRFQIRPRDIAATDATQAVIKGANVFTGALILFYVFVGALLLLIAAMLAMPFLRRQPAWRVGNWWLYPVLILAAGAVIWFKNIDAVRADVYLKQGEQYRGQGQYDSAIALHERSVDLDSDEDFYYLMLALDYQLKGQDGRISAQERGQAWAAGEQIALEARQINPYNPDNTGNMGRYYFTWAQVASPDDPQRPALFEKALDFFQKATHLAPQNVVYYNLWAQTYYVLGQYEQAEKILQTSAGLDPNFEQTQMLLGDTYGAMGRVPEAAKAHRAAILLSPGAFADQFLDQRLDFYLSASPTVTASGSGAPIQQIISALQEAGSLYPNSALISGALGRVYARMGDNARAIDYYEQAIELGDASPQTALAIADIYLSLKDYENAAVAYQRVLELDPQNVQAHSNLGYVYAQLGRLEEAIQENNKVLELKPDDYISLRNITLLYQESNRLDEAIQEAQRMIEVAPQNELGQTYLLLGSLYEAAQKPDEAIRAYEQAAAAAPDLTQAQAALGDLYLRQGRPEDALGPFQSLAQFQPDDYTVHQQLALIYRQLGRYDEALAAANQALSLAPTDQQESLQQLVTQIEAEKG